MEEEHIKERKAQLVKQIATAEKALVAKLEKIESVPTVATDWLTDKLTLHTLLRTVRQML